MSKNTKPDLVVFQIIETGKRDSKTGEDINYWSRVGSAWINSDASINVRLNSFPIDGKLHIRPPKEDDENTPAE